MNAHPLSSRLAVCSWSLQPYSGDLCIEREAGTQRVADIAAARVMVEGTEA